MERGTPAHIRIIGCNGTEWNVSGDLCGAQGVELDVDPQGFHDEAPLKTIWQQGAFQEGATYLGHTIEPLDLVLAFNIYGDPGRPWQYVEEQFFLAFDPVKETKIEVTTESGKRTLKVVLLNEAKTSAKNDPRILGYSRMVLTLRAPWPFWKGATNTASVRFPTGEGTQHLTVENRSDRPMYLQWALTAPGKWWIPDYSWQQDQYAQRVIETPTLTAGQHLTIDTYPREETFTAADASNIAGRFLGRDFLFPVPPHTPPTQVPIRVQGGGTDAEAMVRMVEYWRRPYGGRS